MKPFTTFVQNKQIYQEVFASRLPKARKYVWIATADIKDLYVKKGNRMVPFLEILSDLLLQGVEVKLIYAKEPGTAFQHDFDKYPVLAKKLQQMHCPRVHFKSVIIDGAFVFTGSANLTGAGMGAKSEHKRNFENGIISTDFSFVDPVVDQFQEVWTKQHCKACGRKEFCSEWRHNL